MKALEIRVRRIGNSLGVVIPKPVLAQAGVSDRAELTVERDAIVLRRPRQAVRSGWAEAAQTIAAHGAEELLLGEFSNADDAELTW
jgi:antitoxin MazE